MLTSSQFRVLVVRLSAMGDILHALPAITALRQMHPAWQIDWVIEPRWQALLVASTHPPDGPRCAAKPLVDHIRFAPTKAWGKKPMSLCTLDEILRLRRELHAARYDAVLDLQGSIRSSVVARLAGCRRILGSNKPRESAARWLYHEQIKTHGVHVIEQATELANAIAGDRMVPIQPLLPVDGAAEIWVDEMLSGITTASAVLINPGAGWGAKCWPVERYAEVARALIAQGYRVLVNAGSGEEALANAIVAYADETARGLCIPLFCTVAQLIAITRRVALVIAGDTGPLHLACALNRPVVAIFGPTDPRRNGPFGTRFKVLRNPHSQRDHRRHTTPEAGLLTITTEAVLETATELLKASPPEICL